MSKLQDFSAYHTPLVIAEIKKYLTARQTEAHKLSPHLVQSVEMLSDFSLRGGKAIRPLLVILGYQLAGGTVDDQHPEVYQVAAGVELLHKHILNLDDMADRDESRYGGPTLWKAYEKKFQEWPDAGHHARTFAEIDGTLLGSFAFELVRTARFLPNRLLSVIGLMNTIMYWQTVAGWQIQYFLNHVPLAEATEAEFLRGLELVTAEYTFVAPLSIGVTLANDQPDKHLLATLREYGRAVGTAFQIQDDILGLFGDPAETGKPVGNDVREGKKTLLLQREFAKASNQDQQFLADVCGRELKAAELERVQGLVRDTGALEYSQDLAERSIQKGLTALEKMENLAVKKSKGKSAKQEAAQILKELAQFVLMRKK